MISSDSLLGQAINELMALFTPARWAYEDVVPSLERQGRERLLEVRTPDKVHADLRLNTAELNTFAMTLFLVVFLSHFMRSYPAIALLFTRSGPAR